MDENKGREEAFLALQKIKKAEERARKFIEEAREVKASKIIQEAYEETQRIKEDSLAKARKEAKAKKKAIIQKAAAEADKIRKKAEKEAEDISRRIEAMIPEAVEKTIEKIRLYLKRRSV